MRTFRVRYQKLGGHIHCRVFSAENPSGTFAKLGDLVMDEKDWNSFRDQIGGGWQLLPEERLEDETVSVLGPPVSQPGPAFGIRWTR